MTSTRLVLLPGLLCDATVWREQVRDLQEQVDCHVPDYGELDSLPAMARHVLETAPAGPFSLAGHSMGGRVALEVLRQAPHRVQRLALMDTGYEGLPEGAAAERERAGRFALLTLARSEGMRAMGAAWARGMVHASRLGTPLFDEILDMIERRTPAVFAAQISALLGRPDAGGLLAQIVVPTLVVCGRDDQWSPLARHEQMANLIARSQLRVIEDCGHMVTMEQPAAVTACLRAWLGVPARVG